MAEKRKYTSDDYFAMTDLEGRYELVSGELYDMSPSPSFFHQHLSKRLLGKIDRYIMENDGKCIVLAAPMDVKLDEENTVQPDIFVLCDPDRMDEQKCSGAPDWVIEILSPSNLHHDMVDKLVLYEKAGVKEYWIVDPMSEKIFVYPFGTTRITGIYTFDDEITAEIYKDAKVPLKICLRKLI